VGQGASRSLKGESAVADLSAQLSVAVSGFLKFVFIRDYP